MTKYAYPITLFLATIVSLCSAATAVGQVGMPHTQRIDPQEVGTTGWAETLVFGKFDPLLGVLTEVEVRLTASVQGELKAENLSLDPAGSDLSASLLALVTLGSPNGNLTLETQPTASAGPTHVGPFDLIVDFAGPSAVDWGLLEAVSTQGVSFTAPADLEAFTAAAGDTTFPVLLTAAGAVAVQGSAGPFTVAHQLTPQTLLVGATVDVVYHVMVEMTCDTNGLPDECAVDCNTNGTPDDLDVWRGVSRDCNRNLTPDECDIRDGTSQDADFNGIPDECRLLHAAVPVDQHSLCRTVNNVVRLTFDGDIAAPAAGQILIQKLGNGGLYDTDLSTDFTFTVENDATAYPRVLKIMENGSCLDHRTWVAIRNVAGIGGWAGVADFEVQYVVQVGDVNDDGKVLANDLSSIFPKIPTNPAEDQERADVNGDGQVLANDLSAVFPRIPSAPVPKPNGH